MRTFMMAIRRTNLQVNFSSGFNPHMQLYFAPPLPVGTSSVSEYLVVDSDECSQKFMLILNDSLPSGVKILKAAAADKNPNFAAISRAASYDIKLSKKIKLQDFNTILDSDTLEIEFEQKGVDIKKEVRANIFKLEGSGDNYRFTLAAGNKNLRADRLISHLLKTATANCQDIFISTTKINTFTHLPTISPLKQNLSMGELIDVDELFF